MKPKHANDNTRPTIMTISRSLPYRLIMAAIFGQHCIRSWTRKRKVPSSLSTHTENKTLLKHYKSSFLINFIQVVHLSALKLATRTVQRHYKVISTHNIETNLGKARDHCTFSSHISENMLMCERELIIIITNTNM